MTKYDEEMRKSQIMAINELSFECAKEAIKQLKHDGVTSDSELPFIRSTYNHVSLELCAKLQSLGLVFLPNVIGTFLEDMGNVYAIYNPEILTQREAVKWLKMKYKQIT